MPSEPLHKYVWYPCFGVAWELHSREHEYLNMWVPLHRHEPSRYFGVEPEPITPEELEVLHALYPERLHD